MSAGDAALWMELERAAAAPVLLVATDFDGVLAHIVDDPGAASADGSALGALHRLSRMEQTNAGIISGRALADLRRRVEPGALHLIGSHGAEGEFIPPPAPADPATHRRVAVELAAIAATAPGLLVEEKPYGAALHYRAAAPDDADRAVAAALSGPGAIPGVRVTRGHKVVEFSIADADKGTALRALAYRAGAAATVFIGDDLTDEHAFAALGPADVGVKVGEDQTVARWRIAGTAQVTDLLHRLVALRAAWLARNRPTAIERYSLLSDQRTVALVDDRASIAWLCLPRIDSPALFADLLGGPAAGAFAIAPEDEAGPAAQAYDGETFTLVSRWPGLTVTDYLDTTGGRSFMRAGRTDLVRVVEGTRPAHVRFAPRSDYGRAPTRIRAMEGGLEVEGTNDPIVLHSPGVAWRLEDDGDNQTARARIDPSGGPVVLELRYGTGNLQPAPLAEPLRRAQSERAWNAWSATLNLPPLAPALVRRSALVIRALCHGPTGAILAAGTTSLPEWPGGVRNWDYRFCWVRDAALAAASLVRLGSHGVAMKYLDWVLGVLDRIEGPERLRPLYTVSGSQLGAEAEIGTLAGYRMSRPVRIGNAASAQVQLDVFGPIVDLVWLLAKAGAAITPDHWRLVEAMALAVERRWEEPDHGIWEVRLRPRHHFHSKVMCWVTLDRALRLAEALHRRPRPEWASLRDRIARDALQHGWHAGAGAFTTAYGVADLDAASLCAGLCGLLPADDACFVATVAAVDRSLRAGPTVYRYRCDDGLAGSEGGFHLCTGWLIQALTLTGRVEEAATLFRGMTALAGPTGLIPEQFDPVSGLALGNHPQVYSHVAVIDAAVCLAAAGVAER